MGAFEHSVLVGVGGVAERMAADVLFAALQGLLPNLGGLFTCANAARPLMFTGAYENLSMISFRGVQGRRSPVLTRTEVGLVAYAALNNPLNVVPRGLAVQYYLYDTTVIVRQTPGRACTVICLPQIFK